MNGRAATVLVLSFLFAMVLSILPLPHWAEWLRPEWVVLLIFFWVFAWRQVFGVGCAWLIGLMMDLLHNTLLGEHALASAILAYGIIRFAERLELFSLRQQVLAVFVLTVGYEAVLFITQGILGQLPNVILFWLPAITTALLWPWVYHLLRDCQRWTQNRAIETF